VGRAGRVGDADWLDVETESPVAQSQTSRPSRSRRNPFGQSKSHRSTSNTHGIVNVKQPIQTIAEKTFEN